MDLSKEHIFKILQAEGKKLAAEGKLTESLKKFELAKDICPTPKVLNRIERLKSCISEMVKESSYNDNLSSSLTTSNLSSKRVEEVSPKMNSSDQSRYKMPKVLNDIQNVQNSGMPRVASKSADLSPISQSKFRELKRKAKESAYSGEYEEGMRYFREALKICDCPNVKKYIGEIEKVMRNSHEESPKSENISEDFNKKGPSTNLNQKKTSSEELYINSKEDKKIFGHDLKSNSSPEVSSNLSQELKSTQVEESDLERKLSKVKILYNEARDLAAEGRLSSALKVLKKAQSIHETQKVENKIKKLEELIEVDLNDSESNQMVKISEDFSIFHDIYKKLYPYQREGVAWMWKLFKMGKGGVLGDDMGLGKTFQVIAFISGMIDADLVKHVLIIMPMSLLKNWTKEFKKWCPGIAVFDFHSGTKKERERNLLRVQKRGHVLLTTYGMVVNNVATMIELEGSEFVWDYVILDEGHKIKNPTKTTKAVYEIPSKNRLVLTGTPIQNNLRELWTLYDFVQQGTLLGSQKTFKLQYENPITSSREKDATAGEKRLGTEIAENLKSLIKPYFLRRTKDEVWGKNTEKDVDELGDEIEKMTISKMKAKKNDFILWTFMSEPQIEIYKSFLHSDAVKSILVSKRSPLVELTTLKKICDHPRLLSQRACLHLGLNGDLQHEDLHNLDDESTLASSIENVTDETLLIESGKLKLVVDLLENMKDNGHRTLVFSLSRKILDMIHRILVNKKWKVMRLDGTISKTEERERRIQTFQNDPSYPVFLLTTQVGGVGLTLTAADRVIIYDPSWNPATDAQAVDRIYRIGQEKDIIVYRLITCGSVEEKIYRRQIFKDSITRQTTGAADPFRYFSKQELKELFSFEDPFHSKTQVQLHEMHSFQRRTDDELDKHIEYLQTLNIFGISDHDLMFSRDIQDHAEDNDQAAVSENFIKKQVETAHELIKMEASVVAEGIRLAGTYNRPYQETLPLPKRSVTKDVYKPPTLPEVIDLTENAEDEFLSLKQKLLSSTLRTSDIDINSISPNNSYQVNKSDKESLFTSQTKMKNFFPVIEKAECMTSPKTSNKSPFTEKNLANESKVLESSILNQMNASSIIEKMRKSVGCPEPTLDIQEEMEEALIDEKGNSNLVLDDHIDEKVDIQDNKTHEDAYSISFKEKNESEELKPLKLNFEVQGKFSGNVTPLMYEDLKDLDLDLDSEVSDRYVKGSRKSCARKSTFMISDSETSNQSSNESNLEGTVHLVDDSEDAASEEGDSSNSASISFVPDSSHNTPETAKLAKVTQSVSETPPRVFCFESESFPGLVSQGSDSSFVRKLEGSVRRITPLKVDKNLTPKNSSFAQAMATSVILTPDSSPQKSQHIPPSSVENVLHKSKRVSRQSSDDDYTPVRTIRKKKFKRIQRISDSSDSETETAMNIGLTPNKATDKNKDTQSCSESSASGDCQNVIEQLPIIEEYDKDSKHSELDNKEKNNSDSEVFLLSDDEKSNSYSESTPVSEDESDPNDSEYSNGSEDEQSHNLTVEFSTDSDESGSVFSQNKDLDLDE